MSDDRGTPDADLEWGKLQLKAFVASKQVELQSMEAELIGPAVDGDQAVADGKRAAIEAFRKALAELERQKYQIGNRFEAIARRSRYLSYATRGENCGSTIIINMWHAWSASELSMEAIDTMRAMTIPADDLELRAAGNFADVRKVLRLAPYRQIPPEVTNALEMVGWLRGLWFLMPRQGTRPYEMLCECFCLAGGDPAAERAKWQKVLDDAAAGVYTVFDPIKFATIPNDPAVAALVGRK